MNYLAEMTERPSYYIYPPPPGTPRRNTKGDRRRVAVHDAARASRQPPDWLKRRGASRMVKRIDTASTHTTRRAVRGGYYGEVEKAVHDLTGAGACSCSITTCAATVRGNRDGTCSAGAGALRAQRLYRTLGPQRVHDLVGGDERKRGSPPASR